MNKNKDIVIFVGPPGSGKGSLSQLCVQRLGWVQLSTGNLCRQHIARGTAIGQQIDFAIKSGKLISDDIVISLVDEWLREQFEHEGAVILDGFPRTLPQAYAFRDLLGQESFKAYTPKVVIMMVQDEVIINRLTNRLICENKACQAVYSTITEYCAPRKSGQCDYCSSHLARRNDDEARIIQDRLETYHKHARDLIDFYRSMECHVYMLDAERVITDVFDDFLAAMRQQPS